MQIQQSISWQSVNWPSDQAADQYAIFVGADATPAYTTSGGVLLYTVTYDDSGPGVVFTIRPTDGTNYGPAQTVVLASQPMSNRAWLRARVRKLMSDRTDNPETEVPNLTDDELNDFIVDAIRNYSQYFPIEKDTTITMAAKARDYPLPADFFEIGSVMYERENAHFRLYLKEKSFKGGETTSKTWYGYPKLGILQPPPGGRFYGGNFDIYEGQIHIDFDPWGDGDIIIMRYNAVLPYPTTDLETLAVPDVDLEMLLAYIEAKAWQTIEGRDVLLSRWRSKEDGGRRDDLPTDRMSTRLFNAWNQWVKQRRSMRPRQLRLVRR